MPPVPEMHHYSGYHPDPARQRPDDVVDSLLEFGCTMATGISRLATGINRLTYRTWHWVMFGCQCLISLITLFFCFDMIGRYPLHQKVYWPIVTIILGCK